MVISSLSYAQIKLADGYTETEKDFIKARDDILADTLKFNRERFSEYYELMHKIKPPEFIIKQAQREWNEGLLQDAAQYAYLVGLSLLMRNEYEKANPLLRQAKLLDPLNIRYSFAIALVEEKLKKR